jgi:hypothetical protein
MGRLLLAACAVASLVAGPARAQPVNDDCIDRVYVNALPFTEVRNVAGSALGNESQPTCAVGPADRSVWYAMTPPVDAAYLLSTCGSDYDTILQLYDGLSCDALRRNGDACNDDSDLCGPGSHGSVVAVRRQGRPSQIVHAQVASVGPPVGSALRFSMRLLPTARNDRCAAARVISNPVFRELLDMAGATGGEAVDPTLLPACGAVGTVVLGAEPHSVWYRYTPARDGPVTVDTAGTTTPIAVAVFEEAPGGGCAALGARAACAANRPAVFEGRAGRSYLVYVVTPTPVAPDVLVFRLTGPNTPPVAAATAPATVAPGAPAAVSAAASSDPDGDPLSFAWRQTAGPVVTLSDPAAVNPRFTAPTVPADTALEFTVAVSDGAAVSPAAVTLTVSPAASDPDRDGVPIPQDRCPATPAGEPVGEDGCSCSDAGHVACGAPADAACAAGRCDPSTGTCQDDPAPAGTPCPDDGDLCTQDVCDGAGACAHPPVTCGGDCRLSACDPATGTCLGPPAPAGAPCADDGDGCTMDACDGAGTCVHGPVRSFLGAACAVEDIVARIEAQGLAQRELIRLAELLSDARRALMAAEAAATVGDTRRARRRLALAARKLARFTRLVVRLEKRRKLPPPLVGALIDAAEDAAGSIGELTGSLPPVPRRRASRG